MKIREAVSHQLEGRKPTTQEDFDRLLESYILSSPSKTEDELREDIEQRWRVGDRNAYVMVEYYSSEFIPFGVQLEVQAVPESRFDDFDDEYERNVQDYDALAYKHYA